MAGVGYVLSPEDHESGIDLDDCATLRPASCRPGLRSRSILARPTPRCPRPVVASGIFVRAVVDGRKVDAAQVEIYTGGRYLTVTGRHVPGTPTEIREAPRLVAYLQERADQIREAQGVLPPIWAREQERRKAENRSEAQGSSAATAEHHGAGIGERPRARPARRSRLLAHGQ